MMGSDQRSEFEEARHHWKTVFFYQFLARKSLCHCYLLLFDHNYKTLEDPDNIYVTKN